MSVEFRGGSLLVGALAIAIGCASPAHAAGANPVDEEQGVEIAVMPTGKADVEVGEFLAPSRAEALGVDVGNVDTLRSRGPVLGGTAPEAHLTVGEMTAAAPSGSYDIAKTWTARDGRSMLMRTGYYSSSTGKGFGWIKAYRKHNLTGATVVRAATRYDSRYFKSGTKWNYWKKAVLMKCYPLIGCRVKDTEYIVISYDFRKVSGRHFGVVTAHCDGVPGKCDDWVNRAL